MNKFWLGLVGSILFLLTGCAPNQMIIEDCKCEDQPKIKTKIEECNIVEVKEIEKDKITSGLMALQKTIIESIKSSSAGEANLELITEELNLTNYTLSGIPLENKIALKSIKLRISRALYLSSSILKAEVSLDPNHEKKIGVLN